MAKRQISKPFPDPTSSRTPLRRNPKRLCNAASRYVATSEVPTRCRNAPSANMAKRRNHDCYRNSMSKLPTTDNSPFLKLPVEIRLMIYRYLLHRPYVVDLTLLGGQIGIVLPKRWDGRKEFPDKRSLEILRVSQQVADEALEVLYGEHLFSFELTGYWINPKRLRIISGMTETNKRRIRRLEFILVCPNIELIQEISFDTSFWEPVLRRRLLRLYVVAEHKAPLDRIFPKNQLDVGEHDERAEKWMKPALDCIQQNLSTDAIVGVDTHGSEKTSRMLTEYFPKCQHGCTFTGDRVLSGSLFESYTPPAMLPRLYEDESLRSPWSQS